MIPEEEKKRPAEIAGVRRKEIRAEKVLLQKSRRIKGEKGPPEQERGGRAGKRGVQEVPG